MAPQLDEGQVRTALRNFIDIASAFCARAPDARDAKAEKVMSKVVPVLLTAGDWCRQDHERSLSRSLADEVADVYRRFKKSTSRSPEKLREELAFLVDAHLPPGDARNAKVSFLVVTRKEITASGGSAKCAYERVARMIGMAKRTLDGYKVKPLVGKRCFGAVVPHDERLRFALQISGLSPAEIEVVMGALREEWSRQAQGADVE